MAAGGDGERDDDRRLLMLRNAIGFDCCWVLGFLVMAVLLKRRVPCTATAGRGTSVSSSGELDPVRSGAALAAGGHMHRVLSGVLIPSQAATIQQHGQVQHTCQFRLSFKLRK